MDSSIVPQNSTTSLEYFSESLELYRHLQKMKLDILEEGVDYYIRDNITIYNRKGWSRIAWFFGISTPIIKEEYESHINELKEEVFTYHFTVRAILRNGRIHEDVGSCSNTENKVFERGKHDIRATALTRARGRAISGIIGGGIIAEELDNDEQVKPRTKGTSKPEKKIL